MVGKGRRRMISDGQDKIVSMESIRKVGKWRDGGGRDKKVGQGGKSIGEREEQIMHRKIIEVQKVGEENFWKNFEHVR